MPVFRPSLKAIALIREFAFSFHLLVPKLQFGNASTLETPFLSLPFGRQASGS